MCSTSGPKMFFQPSELGSQGNDMATVHASNPQPTTDVGFTPQPPPPPPPTPPTPAPSPVWGGGPRGPGGFGNSPLFRSPFDPANRGRMGGPRINWREGEGMGGGDDNVDLSTLRWGAGAPMWAGRPGGSPTSPTMAPTAPPPIVGANPTGQSIWGRQLTGGGAPAPGAIGTPTMTGYTPFSSMLPSPARSGAFRRPFAEGV